MTEGPQLVIGDQGPVKPGLPLLVPLAIIFWLACACTYGSLAEASLDEAVGGVIPATAAALILCLASAVRRIRIGTLAGAALSFGIAFGFFGAATVIRAAEEAIGSSGSWTLELEADAVPGTFGASAPAQASGPNGERVRIIAQFSEDEGLQRGAAIATEGAPRAISESSQAFYWDQGIAASLSVSSFEWEDRAGPISWIRQARATALEAFGEHGGDRAGLLQALACGYRPTLSGSGDYEQYKTCGLAHLVAVSGAHLAIVVALLRWLLARLRAPMLLANGLTILFIAAYLVFAGIPISAVRAAAMVMLAVSATTVKRRSASLNALALCIIAFIAFDPPVAVSASFILSVGSTLGILLFAGLISSWFSGASKRIGDMIGAPLGMTLASNIATLPYSAALFSQVPLIAPMANVIAAPLFALACTAALSSAIIACIAPPIAAAAVALAGALAWPLSATVGLMARIPYACIAVSVPQAPMVALSIVLCIALWVTWPRLTLKALGGIAVCSYALIAALLAVAPYTAADEIVMVDVAQGDAFLVRSRGRAVLIDTGNKDALLREELGKLGVHRLDAVVISHPDDDHCGSLPSLAGYADIGAVIVSDELLDCACDHCSGLRAAAESATGHPAQGMDTGDALNVGIFTLTAIWPDAFADEGGNADSLCLLAEADCDEDAVPDWSAVFLGDAESDQLAQIMQLGRVGSVDVLKVGHHGSKASLTEELAARLDPDIALISCGANNRYGHPTEKVLECLSDVPHVLRSDRSGTVALRFAKEGIAIREEVPSG